jgi:competence protein ComEA
VNSFNIDELIIKFRYPLLILLIGLVVTVTGVFYFKSGMISSTKVEVLSGTGGNSSGGQITAEIAGEVVNPGVYTLPAGSWVEDLLVVSGGFSAGADRVWTDQYLNRAAKLTDGQKVYIPSANEQSTSLSAKSSGGYQTISSNFSGQGSGLVNINSGSASDLDSLPGIGPVYAQSIIEHRPYSTTDDLVSKGAIKQTLYEKIKDMVTVY